MFEFVKNLFNQKPKEETIDIQGFTSSGISFISKLDSSKFNKNLIVLYSNPNEVGSSTVSSIVDMLKSWIVGNDISITSQDKETQTWLDGWIKEINFYLEVQKYALNSQLEGKILTAINSYKKDGQVIIKPVLMSDYLYSYQIKEDDENNVIGIEYQINEKSYKLAQERFVYSRFNLLQTTDPKYSPAKCSYVVNDCIEMEWALNVYNEVINKFKNPSYVFVADTWQNARTAAETMKVAFPNGFEFGKGLAMAAKPELLQFPLDKVESLTKYIFERARKISVRTGIPLYLLGFPDIVNYATSRDMLEAIRVNTSVERVIFSLHVKKVVDQSINYYNTLTGSNLVPNVDVLIPPTSNMELENQLATFKDLFDRKIISKTTIQELLPMIDPKVESARLLEEAGEEGQIISNNIQRGIDQIDRGVNQ